MPSLTLIQSDGTETKFLLEGDQIRVGRAEDNDVVLADERVSSHHAVFKLGPTGDYLVNDLGATNVTRVNGKPIQLNALATGDTILIGDYYVIYEGVASAVPTPAVAPGRPSVPGRPERNMTSAAASAPPAAKGCFALFLLGLMLALSLGSLSAALVRW
jgi:pSer/pThr/pTyr-binding forkhead associated (FHA) protein